MTVSTPTISTVSPVPTVGQTALSTAEQLLPVILTAIASGAAATTPQGAIISMVAQIIPPLIQSFGATSSHIQQLLTALSGQITVSQNAIDAAASARGIVDPTPQVTA